jgi:hypothetical protein
MPRLGRRFSRLIGYDGRMPIKLYSRVRLTTDRFESEGAKLGGIGYVIEIYDDSNYEIEFSDRSGISYAQIVARPDELEPCENSQN